MAGNLARDPHGSHRRPDDPPRLCPANSLAVLAVVGKNENAPFVWMIQAERFNYVFIQCDYLGLLCFTLQHRNMGAEVILPLIVDIIPREPEQVTNPQSRMPT